MTTPKRGAEGGNGGGSSTLSPPPLPLPSRPIPCFKLNIGALTGISQTEGGGGGDAAGVQGARSGPGVKFTDDPLGYFTSPRLGGGGGGGGGAGGGGGGGIREEITMALDSARSALNSARNSTSRSLGTPGRAARTLHHTTHH